MSLFKKLFGPAEAEKTAPKNVNPRLPRNWRVQIQSLHHIVFQPQDGSKPLALQNISTGGMAVLHEGSSAFTPGGEIHGSILVAKEEFLVRAQVRHLNEVLAGCQFIGEPGANTPLIRAIEAYLKVEILGLQLRRVDDAYLKPDNRGKVIWFTDGRQNEIYCILDAEGILAFHLSFLGHYVEGDRARGVRAGRVSDARGTAPGHKGSDILDLSREPSIETLNLTLAFISSVEKMDQGLRQNLKNLLQAALDKLMASG